MSLFDWLKPASVPSVVPEPEPPAPVDATILFVSDRVRTEWQVGLDPLLKRLVNEAAEAAGASGWQFTLTCLIRTPAENDACYGGHGDHLDGVHVRGRGADVRTRDQDRLVVDKIVQFMNNRWVYDPQRPTMKVALYEEAGPGSTGKHLHMQTHPRTVLA